MLQFPSNENGKTASIKMLSLTFRVSTLLSITHLDWGSGKVWQLFDVLTLFSNDGAHCKCRNEQVNSLRFWVSLLDINSLVLLRLGEDRMHRPPPPEHLLNFQTPTRKCQQSILWKLLNSLVSSALTPSAWNHWLIRRGMFAPAAVNADATVIVQWGSYSLLISMFPKSLGVFGNVLHAQIGVKTFGKQLHTDSVYRSYSPSWLNAKVYR